MQYVDVRPALLVAAGFVVGATLAVLRSRGDRREAVRWAVATLLAGSVAVVLTVTLGPVAVVFDGPDAAVNLVPFRDIATVVRGGNPQVVFLNLLGNVALFVPVALLAELLVRRPLVSTGLGLVLSVTVELAQYAVGRSADVDDVILNGLGTGPGVALAAVVRRRLPDDLR